MSTEVFKGKVIESVDGTFDEKRSNPDTGKMEPTGMQIQGWKISILVNRDEQRQFFVSINSVAYNDAKALVKGNMVLVHCDPKPGFGTKVKYVPVQIERIDEPEKKEPPF